MRSIPSDVSRALLQDEQKGALTDDMNPISPFAPGALKIRASPSNCPLFCDSSRPQRLFDPCLGFFC